MDTACLITESFSSLRVGLECVDGDIDIQRHCSSGSEAEPPEGSPPLTSTLTLSASFEEDILDLKWWQSCSVSLLALSQPHLRSICCWIVFLFLFLFFYILCYLDFFLLLYLSSSTQCDVEMEPQSFAPEWVYNNQCDMKVTMHLCVRVCVCGITCACVSVCLFSETQAELSNSPNIKML